MSGVLGGVKGFNSRSREGSDLIVLSRICPRLVFQFTLPRGERLDRIFAVEYDGSVSIHAPARGATLPPSCQ